MPKVVRVLGAGGPEKLEIADAPLQAPGEGEVRIKVRAIGLNRAESMYRMGVYLEPLHPPARIGYDAAGVVDAVGAGVVGIELGEHVATIAAFSMARHGVYGEYASVPARAVAQIPAGLSMRQAAALWMPYLTVYGALIEHAHMRKGDYVVIPAASSSVGLAAIQICRREGASPIAVTRGGDKERALRAAGAEHVVVSNEQDFASRVGEITRGQGARVIFDPVSGSMLEKAASVACPGAMIIEYGWLSFPDAPSYPLIAALQKQLTVVGYTLFDLTGDPERLARACAYIGAGIADHAFLPTVDGRSFPLTDIADAHRYLESNRQFGKIVVDT